MRFQWKCIDNAFISTSVDNFLIVFCFLEQTNSIEVAFEFGNVIVSSEGFRIEHNLVVIRSKENFILSVIIIIVTRRLIYSISAI